MRDVGFGGVDVGLSWIELDLCGFLKVENRLCKH